MLKGKSEVGRGILLRIGLSVCDVLLSFLLAIGTYWLLHWGGSGFEWFSSPVLVWAAINGITLVLLCLLAGLYTMIFSSAGFPEMLRILLVLVTVGCLNLLFVMLAGDFSLDNGVGYRETIVYCLLLFWWLSGTRFSKRAYASCAAHWQNLFGRKKRVMIVGFNNDAFTLIRNMIDDKDSEYKAVCIVDDDARHLGQRIHDVYVVGNTLNVREFAKKYRVQEIFVVLPLIKKSVQSEIIQRCQTCGCPVHLLPELSKMTNGEISVSKLRPVQIEDLLGREPVQVNLEEVMGYIQGKRVLVTGGGGSIGSELCRQLAGQNPAQLIILDIYENNAYDIEQELKRHYPELNLLTLIASVRDERKIRDVFEKYRPQIVFNAAAHKHVPLMETSPNEAVKNNVFGTLNVARAAADFRVETFVQISTDKAVNPTNIMGATKRICEMIIQTIGKNSEYTKFVAVRFGNVLGSNGSVIPLFKKQIEEGGPVTLTHKDIIRYFMTIPEAVSLVLQTGAYAQNGQIFVLDMGEPVKIYDLACNLIRLSGLEPNVDIEIKCTGLRPGEKLYEERLMDEEGLQKTPNGMISVAKPIPLDEKEFLAALDKLREAAYNETDDMKEWVQKLVPTYTIDNRESATVRYFAQEKAEREETVVGG